MSTQDLPEVYPALSTLESREGSLSINEYATACGLSPKTVRRRIKAGSLAAVLVDGPHGAEYRIPTLDRAPVHPSPATEPLSTLSGYPTQGKATPPPIQGPEPFANAYEARWVAALEREKRLEAERGTLQAQLKAAEQAAAEAQAEREFLRDRLKAAEISVNRQQEIALRAQQQADALRGELSEVRGQLADATTPKALPEAAPAPRRPWWKVWG